MKIALVHDYLCGMGGSERVFQYICEAYPDADIFTLAYNPKLAPNYFAKRSINTTWLNTFVKSMETFRWSFPIASYVMESIDLRNYDLVLSSSATVAKYVKTPGSVHICYCYIPTRALWQTSQYFGFGLKKILISPFLNYLRRRDFRVSQRPDKFIAISEFTKQSIKKIYNRDSDIIYSPIDLSKFTPKRKKNNNFLIVSRLEEWKRVDYAIEAFNRLKIPLKIIGTGAEEGRLKRMANKNIQFLGGVDDNTLAKEYSNAQAVIFTPFLEYGLIPLEANASGTPVICLGKGGVLETMIPANEPWAYSKNIFPTAVFFS